MAETAKRISSGLEGEFKNAIVTEVGAWDVEGKSYPYLGLFNGRENVQLPIDKDCTPPADLVFGDKVNVWVRVTQGAKVVGDRAIGKTGLRCINVERAAGQAAKAA